MIEWALNLVGITEKRVNALLKFLGFKIRCGCSRRRDRINRKWWALTDWVRRKVKDYRHGIILEASGHSPAAD